MPEDFDVMSSTAICVFAFKRPDHLRSCLSALVQNEEAKHLDLRLYVDAPRQAAEIEPHRQVLDVCAHKWPFASIQVFQAKDNRGLYDSLVAGISETLEYYESAIVIEDDIQSSPFLIRYFLDGLALYKNSKEVASIHGYTPPISQQLPETFFLRGADCWGWATWRDRWDLFRHDAAEMAQEIRHRGLVREFNLNGNYGYLEMLDACAAGLNNSWAICWHASCFLANKLTLYPGKSLVRNIGLDGSGEHCGPSEVMATEVSVNPVRVERIPVQVTPSVYRTYSNHFANCKRSIHILKVIQHKLSTKVLQLVTRKRVSKLELIGPYDSYEDAAQRSTGYASKVILDKVYTAVVSVLEGGSAYERDGTPFEKRPSIDNLRLLLSTHLRENDFVVDFGGGLGGSFINNRDLFCHSNSYTVVEQSIFANAGRELSCQNELQIQFVENITLLPANPDIVILSCVLQYLRDPEHVLREIRLLQPRCIIVDRTFIANNNSQEWFVQDCSFYYSSSVNLTICPIPKNMLQSMLWGYELKKTWVNDFDPPMHFGFLFVRSPAS